MVLLKRNKMMRGGGTYEDIYDISSYILLFISYIFFGFATILLINAGLNYNKAYIDENAVEEGTPLIEQPIFEYLKRNKDNFMAVEDYLLAIDMNKPLAIIFICFIGGSILLIIISKRDNLKKEITKNLKTPNFLIALAIYGVMLGIIIAYNVINSFKNDMPKTNLAELLAFVNEGGKEKEKEKEREKQEFYNELRRIILDSLNKNDYTKAIEYLKDKVSSSSNEKIKNLKLGDGKSVSSYILYYYYDAIDKNKYKNHINNYFNLLINDDKPEDNNYIKYYIYGLLENQDKNSKAALKKPLLNFKNNIESYYKIVFGLYSAFFLVVILRLGVNEKFKDFVVIYWWDILKVMFGIFLIYIPILLTMFL
jgi:hypothetical protein